MAEQRRKIAVALLLAVSLLVAACEFRASYSSSPAEKPVTRFTVQYFEEGPDGTKIWIVRDERNGALVAPCFMLVTAHASHSWADAASVQPWNCGEKGSSR